MMKDSNMFLLNNLKIFSFVAYFLKIFLVSLCMEFVFSLSKLVNMDFKMSYMFQ